MESQGRLHETLTLIKEALSVILEQQDKHTELINALRAMIPAYAAGHNSNEAKTQEDIKALMFKCASIHRLIRRYRTEAQIAMTRKVESIETEQNKPLQQQVTELQGIVEFLKMEVSRLLEK